jgi:hypothetical protein
MDAHGDGNYVDSGETPTGVGRCLRGHQFCPALHSHYRRNPHRSGEVFARQYGAGQYPSIDAEKPPPEWGGVCEGWAITGLSLADAEKPPPRWGSVCDAMLAC